MPSRSAARFLSPPSSFNVARITRRSRSSSDDRHANLAARRPILGALFTGAAAPELRQRARRPIVSSARIAARSIAFLQLAARCPATRTRAGASRLRTTTACAYARARCAPRGSSSRAARCRCARAAATADREHVEAVVAGPRAACRPAIACRRIAVRRGDHAHVDVDRLVEPPTRMSFEVSSTRSSLTCRLERHLGDLVEEQRAAVRALEVALVRRLSAPVKLPFSWPNSSLSISVCGDRAAVDARGTALRCAGSGRWIVSRGQLLARAALAREQDARAGRRDATQQVVDLLHRLERPTSGPKRPISRSSSRRLSTSACSRRVRADVGEDRLQARRGRSAWSGSRSRPSRSAFTADSTEALPVMTTKSHASRARSSCISSRPSPSGKHEIDQRDVRATCR